MKKSFIIICCSALLVCGCTKSDNDKKTSIEPSETAKSVEEDIIDTHYGFGDEDNASKIFNYNEEDGRYNRKFLKHFEDITKLQEGDKEKILEILTTATGDKVSARDIQESELSKEMYSFTFGYTNAEKSEYNQLLLSGNYAVNSQGEIFHVDGERLLKNLNLSEHTEKCGCGASLAYVEGEIIPNLQYLCIDNGEWISGKLFVECYHEIVDREGNQCVAIKDEFVDSPDEGIPIHTKVNNETDNIVCNYGDKELVFSLISNDEYENIVSYNIDNFDVLIDGKWYKMPELERIFVERCFFHTTEDDTSIQPNSNKSFVWDYGSDFEDLPKGNYRIIFCVKRDDNKTGGTPACIVQEFEIR